MKFSVTSSLYYHAFEPSTVICSLTCCRSNRQKIVKEDISSSRDVDRETLKVGLDANRLIKWVIPSAGDFSIQYEATVRKPVDLMEIAAIPDDPKSAFDATAFPYLHASRYVPTDRMRAIAQDLFGKIKGSLNQVLAIEEWLFSNIFYQVGASNEQSWAIDTFQLRNGVCRDFAHLGIGFCRALNIPARYVTVYSYQLNPQDFHAVFEAYIGGTWILFDGTRLAPLNGMIRIATGRDASETAVGNLYGNIQGQGINVWTQVADDEDEIFQPLTRQDLNNQGKVLILG